MSVLYVIREGAVIRRESETIVVTDADGAVITSIESRRLKCVCALTSVQCTTQAMVELAKQQVALSFLNRGGDLICALTPRLSGNGPLRMAQYRNEQDPAFSLARSREVVAAKIHNQRQVLLSYLYERDEEDPALKRAVDQLVQAERQAELAASLAGLRGIEGSAARTYWFAFGRLLRSGDVRFRGRMMRPAPDPVNAALSFGYSLLTHRLCSLAEAVGLDPYVGFLHEPAPGRPSLALDLIEPFRAPVVDRLVLSRFNRRILKPEHFQTGENGEVRFRPEGLKIFFIEWEEVLRKTEALLRFRDLVSALREVFEGERATLSPWRWSAR